MNKKEKCGIIVANLMHLGWVMRKILKFLRKLLIFVLIIVILALGVVEGYSRYHDRVNDTKIAGSEKWMADINDSLLLSQISIPGIHDAGANNVRLSFFSKCQDLSTLELLNDGYRYLDIRLGIDYVDDEPVMNIYHGFVHCLENKTTYFDALSLDTIINECYEFLNQNPSETILFVVKKEHGDETVAQFEEVLSKYTNRDKWLLTDQMPTLGEARGKIVLFRRYEDEAGLGTDSGIYLNWAQQKDNTDLSKNYEPYDNNGLTVYVQDRYKYDVDSKWFAFFKTAFDTRDLLVDGNVVINFLSTNGTVPYGHPYRYAQTLNEQFLNMTVIDNVLGWVIVDFGNSEIAQKIYNCNK